VTNLTFGLKLGAVLEKLLLAVDAVQLGLGLGLGLEKLLLAVDAVSTPPPPLAADLGFPQVGDTPNMTVGSFAEWLLATIKSVGL
jgi:hypothetical protein